MLDRWLAQQVDMEKTSSATLSKTMDDLTAEELLTIINLPEPEMEKQASKAGLIGGTVGGAVGGAAGGGLTGALGGGLWGGVGGAVAGKKGERGDAFWRGARRGAALGAPVGAAAGALGGGVLGHSAVRRVNAEVAKAVASAEEELSEEALRKAERALEALKRDVEGLPHPFRRGHVMRFGTDKDRAGFFSGRPLHELNDESIKKLEAEVAAKRAESGKANWRVREAGAAADKADFGAHVGARIGQAGALGSGVVGGVSGYKRVKRELEQAGKQKKASASTKKFNEEEHRAAIIGGAVGGGLHGLAHGVILAPKLAPITAISGAGWGALGGHIYGGRWGKKHPVGRYLVPGLLVGGPASLGGAMIGEQLGKKKKSFDRSSLLYKAAAKLTHAGIEKKGTITYQVPSHAELDPERGKSQGRLGGRIGGAALGGLLGGHLGAGGGVLAARKAGLGTKGQIASAIAGGVLGAAGLGVAGGYGLGEAGARYGEYLSKEELKRLKANVEQTGKLREHPQTDIEKKGGYIKAYINKLAAFMSAGELMGSHRGAPRGRAAEGATLGRMGETKGAVVGGLTGSAGGAALGALGALATKGRIHPGVGALGGAALGGTTGAVGGGLYGAHRATRNIGR